MTCAVDQTAITSVYPAFAEVRAEAGAACPPPEIYGAGRSRWMIQRSPEEQLASSLRRFMLLSFPEQDTPSGVTADSTSFAHSSEDDEWPGGIDPVNIPRRLLVSGQVTFRVKDLPKLSPHVAESDHDWDDDE